MGLQLAAVIALALTAHARVQAQTCPAPQPPSLPLHANGAPIDLRWPPIAEASAYTLWAQWRIPEGPTVQTVELSMQEPRVALPASPEPWRPLTLQVELRSRCSVNELSVHAVLHQLQFNPASACPPVEALEPVRGAAAAAEGKPPYQWLRWRGRPDERFEITWFDGATGRPLHSREVQGRQVAWPTATVALVLIRAIRSCAAWRSSPAAYLLVP
jgi:hypothetical protein